MIEIGSKGTQLKAEDVINSSLGSIRSLKEKYGEKDIDDMIIYFITDLIGFFNVARPMNASQIMQTKNIIIDSYPFFTPEDFSRCFSNIKAMKYGAIYEGLDGGKILTFIQKYEDDFSIEREELNKKNTKEKRETYEKSLKDTSEILLPVLKKVAEDLDAKKEAQKPMPKVRERTPNEKRFDNWMSQFDKHFERSGRKLAGIRFIKRYGTMMDMNKFLEYKLTQYNTYANT